MGIMTEQAGNRLTKQTNELLQQLVTEQQRTNQLLDALLGAIAQRNAAGSQR